jgi:hypothetical protein
MSLITGWSILVNHISITNNNLIVSLYTNKTNRECKLIINSQNKANLNILWDLINLLISLNYNLSIHMENLKEVQHD